MPVRGKPPKLLRRSGDSSFVEGLVHRTDFLMRSTSTWRAGSLAAILVAVGGCGLFDGETPAPTAEPSASVAPPAASASAAVVEPPPSMEVVGEGVSEFVGVEDIETCKPRKAEIAGYLKRGELTIAGRGNDIAAAWLVELKGGKAQIGFGTFSTSGDQVLRDRGIGSAREHAPHIFAVGEEWMVVWFDTEGLAYARPTEASHPPPDIEHFSPLKTVPAEDVGLAVDPGGGLVAASPFGADGKLSVFLFGSASGVKALGVTKHAKKPRHPQVVADEAGYTLVWQEADGEIVSSRFDSSGKETSGQGHLVSAASKEAPTRLSIAKSKKGSVVLWQQGETVFARALDAAARASSPIWKVGQGQWASIVPAPGGPVAIWVGAAGEVPQALVAARVGDDGVSTKGARVSPASTEVKDAPAATTAGSTLALAWTEQMSKTVSTKRAVLRIVEESCIE